MLPLMFTTQYLTQAYKLQLQKKSCFKSFKVSGTMSLFEGNLSRREPALEYIIL